MQCTGRIFVICLLALSVLAQANPVKPKVLADLAVQREQRQAQTANGDALGDIKVQGLQYGVGQAVGHPQTAAGPFPLGAANLQYGRYATQLIGAYPSGPLNGDLGVPMGAGLPSFGGGLPVSNLGAFGAGLGTGAGAGPGYPGAGYSYAFNPADAYGNIYGGMLPGQLQNGLVGLAPNAQNLDGLVNYHNQQGLASTRQQMGNFPLPSQASQLQPQVTRYPLMPGYYPQMGYQYQSFPGF